MKVTNKSTVRVGAAGVAVIGIIVLFLVMFAVERIDSGQTGIIVNLAGSYGDTYWFYLIFKK